MSRYEQPAGVPDQFFASFCLSGVSVNGCRGDALFEPVQLGFEVGYLLLEIFELLRAPVSVVCDGYKLDQYLVVLDERIHSTEGRLEGREPIGGLFRNIEQDLRETNDSLPLCCEIETVKEFTRRKALDPLTSIRISVTSRGLGICQTSFFKHGFVWNSLWMRVLGMLGEMGRCRPQWEGHEVNIRHGHETSARILGTVT